MLRRLLALEVLAATMAACGGSSSSPAPALEPEPGAVESSASGLQAGAPWPMWGGCPSLRGRTTAEGPATPSVKWFFAADAAGPPAIAADGTLYLATRDGKVYALRQDGSIRWTYTGRTGESFAGTPAIRADGTVLVSGRSGALDALSPSGWLLWSYSLGGPDDGVTSPTIGADGTAYVSSTTRLHAVRPDGSPAWAAPSSGLMPAIGADGTVYAGAADGSLEAFEPGGRPRWTSTLHATQMSIADDGAILTTLPFSAKSSSLAAIRPDGTPFWSVALGTTWGFEPITGADGTVLLDTGAGLAAVAATGQMKWVSPLTGATGGSPPVVDGRGTAYVGTFALSDSGCGLRCGQGEPTGAGLQAFRADGTRAWVFEPSLAFHSPAVDASGNLYVATQASPGAPSGGGLFALGSP